MQQLFSDLPEALANTLELSSRLEFTIETILGYEFPRYPVPERGDDEFVSAGSRLRKAFASAMARANADLQTRARRQIERELALIEKTQTCGIFSYRVGSDSLLPASKHSGAGRGSGRPQRRVLFARPITAVDPSAWNCSSNVFFPEETGEWPDIDLDLPSGDEREKVIQYVLSALW